MHNNIVHCTVYMYTIHCIHHILSTTHLMDILGCTKSVEMILCVCVFLNFINTQYVQLVNLTGSQFKCTLMNYGFFFNKKKHTHTHTQKIKIK